MKKLVAITQPAKKNEVRELILKRIEEMKKYENGFLNKARFGDFSTGTVKADASQIEWDKLSDHDLVFLFERLIRRYNAQM
jgi:hypothetical protein